MRNVSDTINTSMKKMTRAVTMSATTNSVCWGWVSGREEVGTSVVEGRQFLLSVQTSAVTVEFAILRST